MNYFSKRHVILAISVLFALMLVCSIARAASPLGASELTVKVIQSGTLRINEPVSFAGIVLAVPQNIPNQVVQSQVKYPEASEVIVDYGGNRMLKLKWANLRKGVYNYSVETFVKYSRRLVPQLKLATNNDLAIGTEHVQLTDRVREMAWSYREASNLDDVAQIAQYANSILEYDSNSRMRTTSEILQAGSGDSLSHAILFASLLRAAGVPSRIAVGDAWMQDKGSFGQHSWVDVLTEDGWVPFDSALLRGGSLNAYIAKWMGADIPSERLEFIGGDAVWEPNADRVEIIESKTAPAIDVVPVGPTVMFPRNLYGWFGVTLNPKGCGFWQLSPLSCVDSDGQSSLVFDEFERYIWSCDPTEVIWTFEIRGSNYVCPIRVDEPSGASVFINTTVNSVRSSGNISIAGLEQVVAGKGFNLVAIGIDPVRESDMIFYSPTLNVRSTERAWTLRLNPGVYEFYLWFDGSLAKKIVQVSAQKAFSIALASSDTAAIGEPLPIRIDVTNLLDVSKNGVVKLRASNMPTNLCWKERNATLCAGEYAMTFEPNEAQSLEFSPIFGNLGTIILTASVEDDSAAFISKPIQVVMQPAKQFERIVRTCSNVIDRLIEAFSILPRMTIGIVL